MYEPGIYRALFISSLHKKNPSLMRDFSCEGEVPMCRENSRPNKSDIEP